MGQSHQKSRLHLPAITHLLVSNTHTVSSISDSHIATWRLLWETAHKSQESDELKTKRMSIISYRYWHFGEAWCLHFKV